MASFDTTAHGRIRFALVHALAGLALAAAIALANGGSAHAQASPELSRKAAEAGAIAAAAQQRGRVRIIVQFASPPKPRDRGDAATAAEFRAAVAATQNSIIAAHFGRSPRRGIKRFST